MDQADRNVQILIFSNEGDEKSPYRKIITGINGLQNQMPAPFTLSYEEWKQGWGKSFEKYLSTADIILLLVSAHFIGFPQYREEMEEIFRKHPRGQVRIIPVLLFPCTWENDLFLKDLRPLPQNRRPISRWPEPDEAINDIAIHLRQMIWQILEKRGYVEEENEEDGEQDASSVTSTVFRRTGSILPLNYLTLSNADDQRQLRLRTIMQLFSQYQSASYDTLSDLEVHKKTQQAMDSDYTLKDCQGDLKYLSDHSNIVLIDDMRSIAHSIPAFNALLHEKHYQATSDGRAIEKFVSERIQASRGRLNKNDLLTLKQHLIDMNNCIFQGQHNQSSDDAIAEKWQSAFDLWVRIDTNSADYLSTLERSAQHDQYDYQKFQEHKDHVVSYVQTFADQLRSVSDEIRELFAGWLGCKAEIINKIAQYVYRTQPDPEKALSDVMAQIARQMADMETWFKEKAEVFYGRALSEIQRVVNRATLLALHLRSHIDNVTTLASLAAQFMDIQTLEEAQQLFDAIFTQALSVHFSEHFAGAAQAMEYATEAPSVWYEPAPARLKFLSGKREKPERRPSDSNPAHSFHPDKQQIYALQGNELQKEENYERRFAWFFGQHEIQLDTFAPENPADLFILEEIIDTCLSHEDYQCPDQTGHTLMVLLNPDEQHYIHLYTSDGTLFLPSYRLKIQKPSRQGEKLPSVIGDHYVR